MLIAAREGSVWMDEVRRESREDTLVLHWFVSRLFELKKVEEFCSHGELRMLVLIVTKLLGPNLI